MREQLFLNARDNYVELDNYLKNNNIKRIFLVCGKSISSLQIYGYFQSLYFRMGISYIRYSDFKPNPSYESVVEGVKLFNKEKCDLIIAVGGGSAIDVAKCIKLFSNMDATKNYLEQIIIPNDIKLLVVPTTAGSGSESTRYAVIYYEGEKQSISDNNCIPSAVMFDVTTLKTLSEYQRKATMMDAFCHAIESFWSVNSTEESRIYSKNAIKDIVKYKDFYLKNEVLGNEGMLYAANVAGKAINITQTTAGHAMCYKLTSLYSIAHGHAAALCVAQLWSYMIQHIDECVDQRGPSYLKRVLNEIADAMNCNSADEAVEKFKKLCVDLGLYIPRVEENDYSVLKTSVNPIRLKNNPIELDIDAIDNLYRQILRK